MRAALAYDRELCSDVLGAFTRAHERSLRRRAKRALGLASVEAALVGAITMVQRADAALRRCVPAEYLIGSVHGGLAATLIDSATGCAVMSALPAGDAWTTLSLRVDYLAGIDLRVGELICEARTVRVGRRTAIADGELRDSAGRVYARGSTTCLVMRA